MASDVVPNGIKIEWNAVQNGVPVVNRVYVTQTTPVGSDDLDDCITQALAFFNAYKGFCHSSYVLQNITATDVSVANGTQTVLALTADNTGTGSGVAAAANAAMTASLRTAKIGRSYRGRFYLGGLVQAALQDAQHLTTASATAWTGVFMDFIEALDGINKTLVVVSRFINGVARVVAVATEVISVLVDTKVDSQRRRTAN